MKVSGVVEKAHATVPLEVQLSPKGRIAKANHLKENRLADYIGQLKILMFAPENLELVKGSPATRRKFMDIELGQIHAVYLYDSMRYNRALKERNAYLKFDKDKIDKNFLSVLDGQLAEHGNKIMLERQNFIDKLEVHAKKIHEQLTHGKENLKIIYNQNVKTDFSKELLSRQDHDIFRHQTSVGPHRDDLQFFINEINVADFGSQGQQRTVALSIKLAEIDLIFEETGEYPILLLDEPTVGIDPELRQEIWEELRNQANQGKTILITTHVMDEAERCDVVLMLRNGKFIAEGSPKEIKEKYQVASVEEAFIVAGKNLELQNKGAAK